MDKVNESFSATSIDMCRNLSSFDELLIDDGFSSESDEAEFLEFAKRIRNTPRQPVRILENKNSEQTESFLSKKCTQEAFKVPQSQALNPRSNGAEYKFVTPLNGLKYADKAHYSESVLQRAKMNAENEEITPYKFKTPNPPSQMNRKKCMSSDDSEDEAEFLKFAEKIRSTPRFKARSLVQTDADLPEKKNLFPMENVQKEKNSSKPTDFVLSNSWTPVQKEIANEYYHLFLSKIEDSAYFLRSRVKISKLLYAFYNEKIFNTEMPKDMVLNWKNSLLSTAGLTHCRKQNGVRSCSIDLSSKLLTSFDRLQDTLMHEMCHAAVFLISKTNDNHGPLWRTWSFRCSLVLPFIKCPERCHAYEQNHTVWYSCPKCKWKVGRHRQSKGLNTAHCRKCNSNIIVQRNN